MTGTIAAGFETALVVQVLDGDTIEVLVEGVAQRLRYIGIDSPEDGQPYSAEAEALNRALVEGKQVVLEKDVSESDRFERLLRYVFLLDSTFVNAELVRLGMAHAAAYEPDTSYQGYFEEMQAIAQEEGLGIWGQPEPTATNPVVGEGLIIDPACSQFNAPGNDNENKNEEYVCVVNPGAEGIDLNGWVLHDEYGWKYTFPVFILRAGTGVMVRTGCGEDSELDLHWCRNDTAV
jgi:endonuclease YncB( thermonuclease family)